MLRKIFVLLLTFVLAFSLFGTTLPASATEGVSAGDIADPSQPAEPVNPAQPVDPTNPTDPPNPADPTSPTNPAQPADPAQPTDPADPANPADPTLPEEPADNEGELEGELALESELELELSASVQTTPLLAGRYRIRPAVSNTRMLDIHGGSRSAGANLEIFRSNNGINQFFDLSFDAEGYYTIASAIDPQLVLDVVGGQARSGANVILFTAHGGINQKWVVAEERDSFGNKVYTVTSALSTNLMLDVFGAADKDAANVQIWTKHSGPAQRFYFLPLDPGVISAKTVMMASIP